MRHILLLLILSISTLGFSQAQETPSKLFIEISAVRYAEIPGLFNNYNYPNKLDNLNGLKFGFRKNEKTEMHVSLMKYTSSVDYFRGFSGVSYVSTSYQFGIGLNKLIFKRKRFSGHVGGEVLLQTGKYDGHHLTDYGPGAFSLEDIEMYELGIASLLQINYKISDLFSVSMNTRFGLYFRYNTANTNLNSKSYNHLLFEPINNLSLRVNIQ